MNVLTLNLEQFKWGVVKFNSRASWHPVCNMRPLANLHTTQTLSRISPKLQFLRHCRLQVVQPPGLPILFLYLHSQILGPFTLQAPLQTILVTSVSSYSKSLSSYLCSNIASNLSSPVARDTPRDCALFIILKSLQQIESPRMPLFGRPQFSRKPNPAACRALIEKSLSPDVVQEVVEALKQEHFRADSDQYRQKLALLWSFAYPEGQMLELESLSQVEDVYCHASAKIWNTKFATKLPYSTGLSQLNTIFTVGH